MNRTWCCEQLPEDILVLGEDVQHEIAQIRLPLRVRSKLPAHPGDQLLSPRVGWLWLRIFGRHLAAPHYVEHYGPARPVERQVVREVVEPDIPFLHFDPVALHAVLFEERTDFLLERSKGRGNRRPRSRQRQETYDTNEGTSDSLLVSHFSFSGSVIPIRQFRNSPLLLCSSSALRSFTISGCLK